MGIQTTQLKIFVKILDSENTYNKLVTYLDLEDDDNEAISLNTIPKALSDTWSELIAPNVELKELSAVLRYAFLGPNKTYHVIINSCLNNVKSTLFLCELGKHRRALRYLLHDITCIYPNLCMHMIYLEDESAYSIEHQRMLNPNLKDVVKKEIKKILEAGIIYDMVSPSHMVRKKELQW